MASGHEYVELVEVTHQLTVNGALKAGARVRRGAVLEVRGSFAGPLEVEADGVVSVLGSFVGDIRSNGGLVMLHGQIDTTLDATSGRVVIGVDSVLTSGSDLVVLRPDGSLEPIRGDIPAGSLNVRTDVVCAYNASDGTFVPLGNLSQHPPGQ